MAVISVRNNNIEGAIKNLRTQQAKEGTLSKLRDKAEGFKKKGLRARLEKEQNIRNCRKNNRKNNSSNNNRNNYRARTNSVKKTNTTSEN